jgi:rSAM/selenodomain-associated transferase 1
MKPTRIIIFAKAPQPGFAKTRLIPALGAEGAATLARQMLLHTLQEAITAKVGTVELCVTPTIHDLVWHNIPLPSGIEISEQGQGDLGARLARASERAQMRGESVLLIGTDCVEMSADLLRDAAISLHQYDTVIHCTVDGGYALLGLKKFSHFLFSNMPWSTDVVATMTLNRIGQLGWLVRVGAMLHDVDGPQDLKYLPDQWRLYVAA